TVAPRGLPATLPVRVVGTGQQNTVLVSYTKGALTMEHQGAGFPAGSVSDSTAYAVLVVDDSTQRAQGVLIYESRRPPEGYPSIVREAAGAARDGVHGLGLSGGEDVEPGRYGAAPHPKLGETDRARDAVEVALVAGAERRGLPILAICRGIQILNVALGGTLY